MAPRRDHRTEAADPTRVVERRTFALVGLVPAQVLQLAELFRNGSKEELVSLLMEEAGLPWAHALETAWEHDEAEARSRGLFDFSWHRRARQIDPIITARSIAGFDVLLEAARQLDSKTLPLLEFIDANDPDNPRRVQGPAWWAAWHAAAATQPGGWLEVDELGTLAEYWWQISSADVEEACLEALGATFTHPGCWQLLNDLGGFFSQCVSEKRSVLVEVDV